MKVFVASVVALLAAHGVSATTIVVQGSGTWDDWTPSTVLTAANTSFAFRFQMDSSVPFNPTTAFAAFSYVLGGHAAAAQPSEITFFSQSAGGGLQIRFGSNLLLTGFGSALIDNGQLRPSPAPLAMTYATDMGYGTGMLTVSATSGSAVPEPVEWVLLICGMGLAGMAVRRKRGAVALASLPSPQTAAPVFRWSPLA